MPARRARRSSRASRSGGSPADQLRRPLEQYLRRGKKASLLTLIVVVLGLVALAWLDQKRGPAVQGGDLQRYHNQTFRVVHVSDGDTLDIAAPDQDGDRTRIRLWGIDTPELEHPGLDIKAEPFGKEAHARAERLAAGKAVRLLLESHDTRDRYERLLAYIELPDGQLLNEVLLAEGLAESDERYTHSRLDRFELLERQAQRDKAGMWKRKRRGEK